MAGLGLKLLATQGSGWRCCLLPQGKESLQETLEQMEKLREQFENLQQGVERLSRSSTEMQVRGSLAIQGLAAACGWRRSRKAAQAV